MKIKGSQVLSVVKALRSVREAAEARAPAHLTQYLNERILLASWYPETDFRDLVLLLGSIVGSSVEGNVWRWIGETGAERDFNGIYASMVRKGDTRWTVQQMPVGWRLYRDSSVLSVHDLSDGHAELAVRGYPVMCPELAEVNAGYFAGALRASGATSYAVRVLKVDERSARYALNWE